MRILDSAAPLPPPGSIEAATLARVHADEHVRLGCQLHPEGDVSIALLMAPHPAARLPVATEPVRPGREEEIAVLFCDLRNFTDLSEARLPYDVVFLLNRYFAIVGQAVGSCSMNRCPPSQSTRRASGMRWAIRSQFAAGARRSSRPPMTRVGALTDGSASHTSWPARASS